MNELVEEHCRLLDENLLRVPRVGDRLVLVVRYDDVSAKRMEAKWVTSPNTRNVAK